MNFLQRRPPLLTSCLCNEATLLRTDFQDWAERLKEERGHTHRKIWEYCFICQALSERGMLAPGKRGLGFAVGQEPLSALYASMGINVVATDLFSADAIEGGWIDTNQHADGYSAINKRQICDEKKLREFVEFRNADMNNIDPALGNDFDFIWSACAFEHLGSLDHGIRFVHNAMALLRPGGVAVHTTEFNLSSDDDTVESGATVLYRKRDILELVAQLRAAEYEIEVTFDPGKGKTDNFIDLPPYKHRPHMKLQIEQYVVTSIGLIIRKAGGWRRWFGR